MNRTKFNLQEQFQFFFTHRFCHSKMLHETNVVNVGINVIVFHNIDTIALCE